MAERIEGSVAAILNDRELVINRGTAHGVEDGMLFAVLNTQGLEISDPESGESLGSVEIPKVMVKIVRLQEHLAVARTYKKRRVNIGGRGSSFTSMFEPPKYVVEYETFKTSDKPYIAELAENQSYVKVGDPVVQASADEFVVPEGTD